MGSGEARCWCDSPFFLIKIKRANSPRIHTMSWNLAKTYSLVIVILIFTYISLANADIKGIENECNQNSQCHPINEYCDDYTNKCHSCVDICMSDISKFEECTNHCKTYLRQNVMRRLDDIESIHTLVCIIIIFTSIILILLLVLLLLKVRGRKRTKSNCNVEDTAMQMKKLQEMENHQTNGHLVMHSSPKHRPTLTNGTSMHTMTTAISANEEDESTYSRRRQPSSSTNNGGSKRSYQSSSAFYDPPRGTNRAPLEDRVPQAVNPSDSAAYDNPVSSRSPTPTDSNHTLKGSSPNRSNPILLRASSAERGPNATRLPPISKQSNGGPSPYTISHTQVV